MQGNRVKGEAQKGLESTPPRRFAATLRGKGRDSALRLIALGDDGQNPLQSRILV
jgi:hypothetical protein